MISFLGTCAAVYEKYSIDVMRNSVPDPRKKLVAQQK